jgi:UDP-N-acetylglucosamine:LPS N-acetylglucosamine transferase
VPSLFVPNTMVADDQTRRAELVAQVAPAVVSPCDSPAERTRAVESLLALQQGPQAMRPAVDLSGAEYAADEILALISSERRG